MTVPSPITLLRERLLTSRPSTCARLRVFCLIFFAGLASHFWPFLVDYGRFVGHPGVVGRCDVASLIPDSVPPMILLIGGYCGCILGMTGIAIGAAALLSLLTLQALMHRNCFPVQTLAISQAWSVLSIMVLGGLVEVIRRPSLAPWRHDGDDGGAPGAWTGTVILYATLIGVLFSGIEKLHSGWGDGHTFYNLLGFPDGHVVRGWTLRRLGPWRGAIAAPLEWSTLIMEIGLPVMAMTTRLSRIVIASWALLFLGIVACLEVPLLFVTTYGAAIVLLPVEPLSFNRRPAAKDQLGRGALGDGVVAQ